MDSSFQDLLKRLDHLSDQFRELKDGVHKAVLVADLDPEMALTSAPKVLELVVHEVYERRCHEPPGTRPLENLIQRLGKDGHFPDRLDAYLYHHGIAWMSSPHHLTRKSAERNGPSPTSMRLLSRSLKECPSK